LQYRVQAEHDLASMTVDKLKLAIRSANSRLSLHLRVSGKKHDLVRLPASTLWDSVGKRGAD